MRVILANPRGFCAGVDRAIEVVERALEYFPPPIFVRHEVVHNRYVVNNLRQQGAIFVERLDEVPDGGTVIFSAHGVPRAVQERAAQRGLRVFDATCPLVTKVHLEVARHAREGREVILIGHAGHPEVEGTMGQYDLGQGGGIYLVEGPQDVAALTVHDPEHLAYVTQTTLSMDDAGVVVEALQGRFPGIAGPRKDDICYATQNRQDAVKQLAQQCQRVLVVGSPNSSNSNRLREVAERMGVVAHLIDTAAEIDPAWLQPGACLGVTAGASAPEVLVREVVATLEAQGASVTEAPSPRKEEVVFALPRSLRPEGAGEGRT